MSRVDDINSFKKTICPKAKLYSQKLERFPFLGIMMERSDNNPPQKPAMVPGAECGGVEFQETKECQEFLTVQLSFLNRVNIS